MLREIRNPDLYHGDGKCGRFFEGWYFKFVDKSRNHVFAFIPGIYKDESTEMAHSFIQVLIGSEAKYEYFRYKAEEFWWEQDRFSIGVGQSTFSLDAVHLDIDEGTTSIKGNIRLHDIVKWKDSVFNPGSMGFYNYFTFMECYSQVCALNGWIEGSLEVNNEIINLDGGRVYIEKNWGRSFPQHWIWVQCNSFRKAEAALSCSAGRVPFFRGSFDGFLVGLMLENSFYSFTSINKSIMDIRRKSEDVRLLFTNRSHTLRIETESWKDKYVTCMGPGVDGMVPLVDECLTGKVRIELARTVNGEVIFSDIGSCAGIEYGGEKMF